MGLEKLNLTAKSVGELTIAGADVSGAKEQPNDTWLAVGILSGEVLEVKQVKKVGVHGLSGELSTLKDLAAVGLDFPFSLPNEFAVFAAKAAQKPEFQSWQELIEHFLFMPFDDFSQLASVFKKEAKRVTDISLAAPALSPLHRGNPSMLHLTFHGMRMLASLDPRRFSILPFHEPKDGLCSVVEVYPREVLKQLGLPDAGYKSKEKKEVDRMRSLRHKLLKGLLESRKTHSKFSMPQLLISEKVEHAAVDSDHALDALLSCFAAACFRHVPTLFADPLDLNNLDVLLEGWIYCPKLLTVSSKS